MRDWLVPICGGIIGAAVLGALVLAPNSYFNDPNRTKTHRASSIEAIEEAENSAPRSLTKPRLANSVATSRSER